MARTALDRDPAARGVVTMIDRLADAEQALGVRVRDSLGVNTVDFAVLRWVERVHRRGGTARVGDVAQHFGVSSGSATEIVHRLTRAGLLERVPDPGDARVRRLEPTEAACAQMAELMGGIRAGLDDLLDTLTEAEEQRIVGLLAAVHELLAPVPGAGPAERAR